MLDLSAVNMNSHSSSSLLQWGFMGGGLRGSFRHFLEQSLKFTVNKLFDHDFIAPVSPKPLDWIMAVFPSQVIFVIYVQCLNTGMMCTSCLTLSLAFGSISETCLS